MWVNTYMMKWHVPYSWRDEKRKEIWILRSFIFKYIIGRVEYSAERTLWMLYSVDRICYIGFISTYVKTALCPWFIWPKFSLFDILILSKTVIHWRTNDDVLYIKKAVYWWMSLISQSFRLITYRREACGISTFHSRYSVLQYKAKTLFHKRVKLSCRQS